MSGKTKSMAFHKYQLLQFGYLIQDNVKAFKDTLATQTPRESFPTYLHSLEINSSIVELMEAYKNVDSWARPEKPLLAINWMIMCWRAQWLR
ncbi:hypothetical protein B0H14DRAFT_2396383 [Mycena olivaceomarginata]|nr:hypothetical protein B0H14DRAFT_2396383 [Mycena olivaceomarginata]